MLILRNYERKLEDLETQKQIVQQRKDSASIGKGQYAKYLLNNRQRAAIQEKETHKTNQKRIQQDKDLDIVFNKKKAEEVKMQETRLKSQKQALVERQKSVNQIN